MNKAEFDALSKTDLKKADWVIRGPMSASDCFRCGNRIDHEHRETMIAIHCLNPCHPRPVNLEERART